MGCLLGKSAVTDPVCLCSEACGSNHCQLLRTNSLISLHVALISKTAYCMSKDG